MSKHYITKEYLSQESEKLVADKLNYFIATMGSGKTTAIRGFVADKLAEGKKVLILTPYIISREEYVGDSNLKNYLWGDGRKLEISYLANIVRGLVAKVMEDVRLGGLSANRAISLFRRTVTSYFDTFDLIVMDEADFFKTQATMESYKVGLKLDDRNYTNEDTILASMILIATGTATVIGISANKFDPFTDSVNNSSSMLSGADTLLECTNYMDTGLHSNIPLKELRIINIVGDSINYATLKSTIIRSLPNTSHTLVYSSTKWSGTVIKALKFKKAVIIARDKNLIQTKSADISDKYEHLNDYENLVVVGRNNNLADSCFAISNIVAVNMSSSRAVSLLSTHTDSRVVIFVDPDRRTKIHNLKADTVQVMGRFRSSPTTVTIYTHNRDPKLTLKDIEKYDKPLIEGVEVSTYNISRRPEYNKIQGIDQLSGVGTRVTKTTQQRQESMKKFTEEYFDRNFKSKTEIFTEYQIFCGVNSYDKLASRNTLLKYFLQKL